MVDRMQDRRGGLYRCGNLMFAFSEQFILVDR